MTINKEKTLNDLKAIIQHKPKQAPKTPDEYPNATELKKRWRLERRPTDIKNTEG